ncbi:MAG: DNA polymerase-3 subunit delta' [Alcanivorax sp.]|jgi:DNA polymerase-3 subunit delta'
MNTPLQQGSVNGILPWQQVNWSQLLQQYESGKLPHALLLAGPAGIGKAQLTVALARLLLCSAPTGGFNCGHCSACHLSASGSHGDYRWLAPEDKSKVIKINQVRAAVDFTTRTASYGKHKVLVLCPADALNINASNALLKCLEEPTRDTHIVLVCERLHALPATIRSRCQMLKFPLPERSQSLDWLDSTTGDRQASEKLLELADDRPLHAQQLYLQGTAESTAAQRSALVALADGRANVPEAKMLLADIDIEALLQLMLNHIQGRLSQMGSTQLRGLTAKNLFALLDVLRQNQAAVSAGANPNRELMMESLLVRLATVG